MTAWRICTINEGTDAGEDSPKLWALHLGDHVVDRRRVELLLPRQLLGNGADEFARPAQQAADALSHRWRLQQDEGVRDLLALLLVTQCVLDRYAPPDPVQDAARL